MAYTITMDAGHGGFDNGASYNYRLEKDDALALTLAVGNILEDYGFRVLYTRTDDIYKSPFQRATEANENGSDLFVSIHRNSGAVPNLYNGIETLVYSKYGFPAQMAENINDQLVRIGYKNNGVSERQNLIVLNSTDMPSLLTEVGFINSDKDNLLFDNSFYETAYAIADGITMTIYPQNY